MAVRRRTILYVPGYDPRGPVPYFRLIRGEFKRYQAVRGVAGRVGPLERGLGPGGSEARWRMEADCPSGDRVETEFRYLGWEDLIVRDMRAGSVRQLLGAFATFAVMLVQGVYAGLFRRHWPAAILAFYPAVLIITTLVLMAASVALMPGWFTSAGLPAWAGAVAGIAVAVGLWHLSAQADQRTYAWYLAADARSAHRLASGRDAEMERRLDHFAREVLAVHDAAGPGDEIVIAGHSSGSFVAVHVMGRVLTWRPDFGAGLSQPPILLTMGSVWALAADFKPSTGYRRGLALLGPARHVDWVEVFAPQDVIGSGRCDPVAEVMGGADLPGKRNPRLCSARLGDSLAPERLERLRWRFFQLHFQFLAATDRPGYFDFHEVLAGPSARSALGLGGEIADASLVGSGGG